MVCVELKTSQMLSTWESLRSPTVNESRLLNTGVCQQYVLIQVFKHVLMWAHMCFTVHCGDSYLLKCLQMYALDLIYH